MWTMWSSMSLKNTPLTYHNTSECTWSYIWTTAGLSGVKLQSKLCGFLSSLFCLRNKTISYPALPLFLHNTDVQSPTSKMQKKEKSSGTEAHLQCCLQTFCTVICNDGFNRKSSASCFCGKKIIICSAGLPAPGWLPDGNTFGIKKEWDKRC